MSGWVGEWLERFEYFVAPIRQTRECLTSLPAESVEKILCINPRKFYRIPRAGSAIAENAPGSKLLALH